MTQDDQPQDDRPTGDQPGDDRPVGEQPADDQPAEDQPTGEVGENQRRAVARDKARVARQRRKRRQTTARWALTGGIALVALAIVAVVVLVISNGVRPAGPGPENMASDGIRIGEGFEAVPTEALGPDDEPTPTETTTNADTVDVVVYLDYLCPECAQFDEANGEYLAGLVESGAATVEYHPVAVLTNRSGGTRYSDRAANAAACVANYSPGSFFDVNSALLEAQPEEGSRGLDDAGLKDVVTGVEGLQRTSDIEGCIDDEQFRSWVSAATERAVDGPIPQSDVAALGTPPLVLVNGQRYDYSTPFRQQEFSNFVVTAAGNSYAEPSTATPTPTPTPSATPEPSEPAAEPSPTEEAPAS